MDFMKFPNHLPPSTMIVYIAHLKGCLVIDVRSFWNIRFSRVYFGGPVSQPGMRASSLHVISRQNYLGCQASPATGPARLRVIRALGKLSSGQERTGKFPLSCELSVGTNVPTESSQDKGNFPVRSRPEENYPEWKPLGGMGARM